MKGLVVDFPRRSPSPVIDWESEEENKEPTEHESNLTTTEVSQTREELMKGSKSERDSKRENSKGGGSSKRPVDDVDLTSTPPSPIISRKRPLFLQRSPLSGERLPELAGNKSPIIQGNKSPVFRRRQKLRPANPRLPVASPDEHKTTAAKEPRGAATVQVALSEDRERNRRGEARMLVGSSWIADLTRMEEAGSGDCSQDIIASWGTEAPRNLSIKGGKEVKREEEEHLPENREQGNEAEAEANRLLGSSWIADLTHMEEQVEGVSQCSASIGSWEGEAKVQPFGDQTRSEIAESFHEAEGGEGDLESSRSKSRKKALKGGLEEQLERALEWGRSGQTLKRHQGDGRGIPVTVQR